MFLETKKDGEAGVEQKPSLSGLIAWLETKNPAEEYEYYHCHGACLIGQYVNAIGWRWGEYRGSDGSGRGQRWWVAPEQEAIRNMSAGWPYTFGAALERARELARTQ
jgi:hypothetical protein